MKITVSADLINSYGEWEDGYSAEFDTLEKAVEYVSTRTLSGSPDCSMYTSFEMFDDKGKLVYKGNSDLLRQLLEDEKSERAYWQKKFKDRTEEELMSFLYDVEIWVVTCCDLDDSDYPIGYFEGSHKQVMDYVRAKNEAVDESLYNYVFVEKLNKDKE